MRDASIEKVPTLSPKVCNMTYIGLFGALGLGIVYYVLRFGGLGFRVWGLGVPAFSVVVESPME